MHAHDEIYKRLTFVLLGVTRPGDLIKDNPHTIQYWHQYRRHRFSGKRKLNSFRAVLDEYFPKQGKDILHWVLSGQVGNHTFTQKLCAEVVQQADGLFTEDELSDLVEQLFLGDKARTETHDFIIRDRVNNSPYVVRMLRIYREF